MASIFELLGGDDATRTARVDALVTRFYDRMDAAPEFRALRAMHPPDLTGPRERLALFLIGWLGGPATYTERFGHPRLRARHLPFQVDDEAARQWTTCMAEALEASVPEEALRDPILRAVSRLALHMRNVDPPAGASG